MSECACSKCISCCESNPGWMTPVEAERAIAAGYGDRLMLDWLEPSDELKNKKRIWVLAPASISYEGRNAPEMPELSIGLLGGWWEKGKCTFLKKKRCEIHSSGFKPLQCRESLACTTSRPPGYLSNYSMAKLWKTREAKSIVKRWKMLNDAVTRGDAE